MARVERADREAYFSCFCCEGGIRPFLGFTTNGAHSASAPPKSVDLAVCWTTYLPYTPLVTSL